MSGTNIFVKHLKCLWHAAVYDFIFDSGGEETCHPVEQQFFAALCNKGRDIPDVGYK